MVELTLAAAMQLRAMLRAAGVAGVPSVRLRPADGGRAEVVLEDRSEPGDRVDESRGIRIHLDAAAREAVGAAVIDLDGTEFVARVQAPRNG